MGYVQRRYKAEVETTVKESVYNYINSEGDKEKQFKNWLFEHSGYYINRFSNTIVSQKPKTKLEVIELVQEEVDKLMEIYEEQTK